jgi:N,N'-diacetyllegionaminate synthase
MVTIAGRRIGRGEPCFVIAEAGVNHNGDVELARRLVDAAAKADADAVKFQTFRAEGVATALAPKASYQLETTGGGESQAEMLRRLELGEDAFAVLKALAEERGLVFLSTPFDNESVELLDRLGVAAFKVSSGDVTNLPLLGEIGRRRRPVILSTGAADLDETAAALDALRQAGAEEIVVLHCVSAYPTPPEQANLLAMATLADRFGLPVGYSDHTEGETVALAAVALGACVLEKHLTLDSSLPGPDHRLSLEPDELTRLVQGVRRVEAALGDGVKRVVPAERVNVSIVRRSLAATEDIPAGTVLAESMLTALRPGTGIEPARIGEVVGRTLRRDVSRGELLAAADLE